MPSKNDKAYIHPDKLQLYDALIKTIPAIERKGASMPYTSLNGHMFSFLNKEGELGLRLPEKPRDEFLKKYKTTLCKEYGTVLKEYVLTPEKLLRSTKELKPWLILSYGYVKTLKPKPAKKK